MSTRPSRLLRPAGFLWLAVLLACPVLAQQRMPVSIELVLAVDTSLSVEDDEYDLQMTGIANAFRNPDVISLIAQHKGVAVTLFQWSTNIDEHFMVPWHLLDSPASILAFAQKVERLPRDPVHGFTAMGKAMAFGTELIVENNFDGRQRKIDISGDGRNNSGILPIVAQFDARAHNIVINGLPILLETFHLDTYFREKIIYGPGAFIEIATDYQNFADAFVRKLIRELTPTISEHISPNALSARASQSIEWMASRR